MHSIVDIARWQFGITTVYHFLFVPLTIGLSALVALTETLWLVRKDQAERQRWLRLSKFLGKLFLITIYSNYLLFFGPALVSEIRRELRRRAYKSKF